MTSKYTGTIEIEDMEFYAFHGCYDTEKRVGNHFLVSVRLDTNLDLPAVSDQVIDTINYLEVYETVAAEMAAVSNILEHVAARIIEAIYARFQGLEKVQVKVSKLTPPLGGPVGKTTVVLTR